MIFVQFLVVNVRSRAMALSTLLAFVMDGVMSKMALEEDRHGQRQAETGRDTDRQTDRQKDRQTK